jgi:hypothetical protein
MQIEPGTLIAITGLGPDFEDETFKIIETTHGINYSVPFIAQSILKCAPSTSSGTSHPGASAQWAVSRSRTLVPGYTGAYDSIVSGGVDILYDQSGNGHDIHAPSAGSRPIATTSGPNGRACCQFSPSSPSVGQTLQTGATVHVSDLLSASAGYMVVSIRPDVVTQNSSTDSNFLSSNANVLMFGGLRGGLTLRTGGILHAYNWDGNEDNVASAGGAVPIGGNPCVIEWRHEGGNVYQRVNGANETSVASGNSTDLTGALKMGFSGSTGSFYNGKIFEAMIYNSVPTQTERDAIVSDMMIWVGA